MNQNFSGFLVVGCFLLYAPKFWEVAGTYEWYFVILWMQIQWWESGGEDTKTQHYAKILFEPFCTQR